MNKLLPLFAFSILLLVPLGSQQVFANHPDLPCPPPGILNTDPVFTSFIWADTSNFCYAELRTPSGFQICSVGYFSDLVTPGNIEICTSLPQQTPDPTLAAQCQGAAILVNNHCFAEALSSMIGGALMDIDTVSLLVGAIGTNPVITALMGITLAGVAGQAAWFVHRRKKNNSS